MGTRLQLHSKLVAIPGVTKVYFQPPQNSAMQYPCILYTLSDEETEHAGNLPYKTENRYQVTVMDLNPDTTIRVAVSQFPKCRFNRFYAKDGLNHYVYELYF